MGHATLAIIGGGNMGGALLRGGVRAGVLQRDRVVVAEPNETKRRELDAFASVCASAGEALSALTSNGSVLLAVKPQMFAGVAEELARAGGVGDRCVISIMAGVSMRAIGERLGTERVVRAMPNLPASISRGITAVSCSNDATPADVSLAKTLFGAIGEVVELEEAMIDAFTAVAGSGPAYVFLLAEAMEKAAREVGFDATTAARIVRQTIAGSAELMSRSTSTSAELRKAVTSKGGTTEAALAVLAASGFEDAMSRAITAARDRGRALGG
jgi:pyrroline-5-carboxylate reductase